MKESLISVIVPIYKVEKYLNECIDSIINQTYRNLEIILVDDGSPDESGKICDKYKEEDSRVIVIHKENGGLSDARNAGINIAKGEFISFIDGDDYIIKDMYETMIKNIQLSNSEVAICGRYYLYGETKVVKGKEKVFLEMNSEQAIGKMCTFGYYDVSSCDKLYKKIFFNNIRFPCNKIGEDWYVIYKVLDKANKIVYDSEPKYIYRQREASITHNRKVNYDAIYASKQCLDFVREKYPNIKLEATTSYIFANIAVYDNILIYKLDEEKENELKEIRKIIKNSYKLVKKNKEIPGARRIQLMLLKYSKTLYDVAFKIFDLIERKKDRRY